MRTGRTFVVALAVLVTVGSVSLGPGPSLPHPASAVAPPSNPFAVPRGPGVSDPATAGATGRLVVETQDPAALPNTGLRTNITAFSGETLPADTSFQVSATETIGGFDAVFGIFENTGTLPVAFFYVFNNTTDAPVLQGYWSNLTLFNGNSYDFELVALNAGTWELTVNGAEFAENDSLAFFDFGAGSATWAGGLLFTEIAFYGATDPVPGVVNIPLALAVRHSGGWYLPIAASTTFSGAGGTPWGIEGQAQHPTLAPGEIATGTSLPPLPNGTGLWSGGPSPVRVGITLSGTSATATTPVFLTIVVDDTLGAPIPGVSVFVADSLGGTSLVQPLVTDGTGTVLAAVELPNVSAPTPDLIQATVTLFGYVGSGGASVQVTPAVQVFLTASGLPAAVAPGTQLTFTVAATDAGGGTVSGASLLITTPTVGGQVTPTTGATGSDGSLQVQLTAPQVPAQMVVYVNVTGGGAWGHVAFVVNVATPAPSFWSTDGGWVELGVGIGITVLVLGALAWKLRSRGRRKLPASYGIRWGEPSGAPRPLDPAAPPTTRRPPSEGTP